MGSLKTKKNNQKLQRKLVTQLNKKGKTGKFEKNGKYKTSMKKKIKYNKKGGGEHILDDNFSNNYEKYENYENYEKIDGDIEVEENFDGALRGLGDGLKIGQPIGQDDNRKPMPNMPNCCIL